MLSSSEAQTSPKTSSTTCPWPNRPPAAPEGGCLIAGMLLVIAQPISIPLCCYLLCRGSQVIIHHQASSGAFRKQRVLLQMLFSVTPPKFLVCVFTLSSPSLHSFLTISICFLPDFSFSNLLLFPSQGELKMNRANLSYFSLILFQSSNSFRSGTS